MKLAALSVVFIGAAISPAGAAMTLTSLDLKQGAVIAPAQIYPRCGGQNISPQLAWSGTPAAAKSLVLTMIDRDVKPAEWSHWVVVDLPTDATSLERGTTALPGRAKAIVSNFGDAAYAGPCPPTGSGMHHYELTIWALPTATSTIAPDASASELRASLAKAALDKASITGSVTR